MKYDKKLIGKRIKDCRKGLSLEDGRSPNQEWLAEFMNYSRKTVSEWENGDKDPSIENLFKLCDLFGCDIGHLVGEPGHELKTKEATDIHAETGLSVDAIDKLRSYSKIYEHDEALSPVTNAALDALDLRQFTQPDLFIPELISYMITSKDFEHLVQRICAQNTALWEFSILPQVDKEIITAAYDIALDRVGYTKADNISLLQSKYEEAVQEYMIEHKEEILQQSKISFADGAYEAIYIEAKKSDFHLAHMVSDRTIEANAFLNSRNLFNIMADYMEPIKEYKEA